MSGTAGVFLAAMMAINASAQWSSQIQSSAPGPGGRGTVGGTATIEGHVELRGQEATNLRVVLMDQSGNRQAAAEVAPGGSFSFTDVGYGYYEVHLEQEGRLVSRRDVAVGGIVERVTLELPHDSGPSGEDTVSLAELRHKPPAGALKEARKGAADLQKQKTDEAIAHFERALELDPDFTAVHADLARLYLGKHDDARALVHLEVVVKQRAAAVWAWANLSAVRFRLGHIESAELAARRTLSLQPGEPVGRYILGISLASLNEAPDEALTCLRNSLTQFPQGHLAIARILAVRGDMAGARTELESYVESFHGTDTAVVRQWLAEHPAPQAAARNSSAAK